MFQKSKRRIRTIIMLVLVVMWVTTLNIIYLTTYRKVNQENQEMMQIYASAYDTHGLPKDQTSHVGSGIPPKDLEEKENDNDLTHRYQVSTFFAVIFDRDGEVKEYLNQPTSDMTDDELQSWAKTLLSGSKKYGVNGNIVYYITMGTDYTMVTMMDNSVAGAAVDTLLKYMVIFGSIVLIILLIISTLLANWVVRPMEEGYEKQKIFVADAGHELKTPISTIDANLAILEREFGDNKWLGNIAYENSRMSVMVHQLLDLARIESVKAVPEEVDFGHIILSAALPFEAKAYENGCTLEYVIDDNLKLQGDKMQLEKLVSILIDNALEHCTGSVVRIISQRTRKGVKFTVSNQGAVIPESEREKLFERFYREDKSRSGEKGHYGLGLAIARAIVESHKGRIWVECENGWVSFCVYL